MIDLIVLMFAHRFYCILPTSAENTMQEVRGGWQTINELFNRVALTWLTIDDGHLCEVEEKLLVFKMQILRKS